MKMGGSVVIFMVSLDGAGACKAALKLLEERHPQIFGQRCATHGWHLILKDITDIEFMHVLSRVSRLLKFVTNHSAILQIFTEIVVCPLEPFNFILAHTDLKS